MRCLPRTAAACADPPMRASGGACTRLPLERPRPTTSWPSPARSKTVMSSAAATTCFDAVDGSQPLHARPRADDWQRDAAVAAEAAALQRQSQVRRAPRRARPAHARQQAFPREPARLNLAPPGRPRFYAIGLPRQVRRAEQDHEVHSGAETPAPLDDHAAVPEVALAAQRRDRGRGVGEDHVGGPVDTAMPVLGRSWHACVVLLRCAAVGVTPLARVLGQHSCRPGCSAGGLAQAGPLPVHSAPARPSTDAGQRSRGSALPPRAPARHAHGHEAGDAAARSDQRLDAG